MRVRSTSSRKKPVFNGADPLWEGGRVGWEEQGKEGGHRASGLSGQNESISVYFAEGRRQKEFPAAEPEQRCVLGGSGPSHSQLGKVP